MFGREHFIIKLNGVANVSRETLNNFTLYEELLLKWNNKINLISKSTIDNIWFRHFLDAAQLIPHIDKNTKTILDIGSGAGFPGLVLSILLKEMNPEVKVICIESDLRKSAFLRTVINDLSLNAEVISERIENVQPFVVDIVTSRALASLSKLFIYAKPFSSISTKCLFLKGRQYKAEIDAATKNWKFDYSIIDSLASNDSALIKVNGFKEI